MLRTLIAGPDAYDINRWCAEGHFAALDAHPFTGGFGRSYYPAVSGSARTSATFCVAENETPIALVPCTVGAECVDWHGLPIAVIWNDTCSMERRAEAAALVLAHITELAAKAGALSSRVADPGLPGALSAIGQACLNQQWIASVSFSARCDLESGEEGLRTGLRKSYRSLVNWGRRNLRLVYVNGDNPDRSQFDHYRAFHHAIAGRATRAPESWDAMFAWVAGGQGELSLGHLESGELVTATLVVDGSHVAYYASGVYDRERFDKPMAHFPLYDAILRARARGMSTFDLGDVPQRGTVSPKEHAIGYFKRGFAGTIAPSLLWTWTAAAQETP